MAGKRRFNSVAEDRICQRFRSGESALQIANSLRCSPTTVERVLRRHREQRRGPGQYQLLARHRDHGPTVEAEVVRLYRGGLSTYQVARKLKVSQGMVGRILRERNEPRRCISDAMQLRAAA